MRSARSAGVRDEHAVDAEGPRIAAPVLAGKAEGRSDGELGRATGHGIRHDRDLTLDLADGGRLVEAVAVEREVALPVRVHDPDTRGRDDDVVDARSRSGHAQVMEDDRDLAELPLEKRTDAFLGPILSTVPRELRALSHSAP